MVGRPAPLRQFAVQAARGALQAPLPSHTHDAPCPAAPTRSDDRWVWSEALRGAKGAWQGVTPVEAGALRRNHSGRCAARCFYVCVWWVGGWVGVGWGGGVGGWGGAWQLLLGSRGEAAARRLWRPIPPLLFLQLSSGASNGCVGR